MHNVTFKRNQIFAYWIHFLMHWRHASTFPVPNTHYGMTLPLPQSAIIFDWKNILFVRLADLL